MEQLLAPGSVWDRLGGAAEPAGAVMVWKVPAWQSCAAGQCTGEPDMAPDAGRQHQSSPVWGLSPSKGHGHGECPWLGLPMGLRIPGVAPNACCRASLSHLLHPLQSIPVPNSCPQISAGFSPSLPPSPPAVPASSSCTACPLRCAEHGLGRAAPVAAMPQCPHAVSHGLEHQSGLCTVFQQCHQHQRGFGGCHGPHMAAASLCPLAEGAGPEEGSAGA